MCVSKIKFLRLPVVHLKQRCSLSPSYALPIHHRILPFQCTQSPAVPVLANVYAEYNAIYM